MPSFNATTVLQIDVSLGDHLHVGYTSESTYTKVIPITGGTFSCPDGRHGEVVPGGADWNELIDGHVSHVYAKYCLRSSTGDIIIIDNEGRSDKNHPFPTLRTTPHFTVARDGSFADLACGTYAASLEDSPVFSPGKRIVVQRLL